jgi:hypothetical protein
VKEKHLNFMRFEVIRLEIVLPFLKEKVKKGKGIPVTGCEGR